MAQEKPDEAPEGAERMFPGEDAMFEFMKEVFAFGYNAAERMEERASEFARTRRERMDEFRRDREEMGSKIKGTFDERTEEIRGRVKREVQNALKETGVATQADLDELKAMIAALSAKLDAGAPGTKKPASSSGSSKAK
jgi:polyhydroxyalkanoate synthesis regulator phasin